MAGRIWKTVMGLVIAGAGLLFAVYLWESYQRAAAMGDWIEVPCEILTAEIKEGEFNQRGLPKYAFQIAYRYEIEGATHQGDRYRRLPTEASDVRKIENLLKTFSPGDNVPCYVDPSDHRIAVLKRESKAALYSIWFPCLFIVGGAGMVFSALFRR